MANILIVEDDKAIQNLLKVALKQENHTINAVGTAREGIDFVVKNIVDLIILDLGLPDMDGINVVETVRSFSENLPIIVVSAATTKAKKSNVWTRELTTMCKSPFPPPNSWREFVPLCVIAARRSNKAALLSTAN